MWVETSGIADGVADSFGIWDADSELRINLSKSGNWPFAAYLGTGNHPSKPAVCFNAKTIHSSKVLRWMDQVWQSLVQHITQLQAQVLNFTLGQAGGGLCSSNMKLI